MSPRTGRPLSKNPKSASLHIRLTPDEKERIMEFSKKEGYTILELIQMGIEAAKKK